MGTYIVEVKNAIISCSNPGVEWCNGQEMIERRTLEWMREWAGDPSCSFHQYQCTGKRIIKLILT
jgi:hypothetical protein